MTDRNATTDTNNTCGMVKTGDIKPGKTPDTESRLAGVVEKTATSEREKEQAKLLDDDTTGRLARAASK